MRRRCVLFAVFAILVLAACSAESGAPDTGALEDDFGRDVVESGDVPTDLGPLEDVAVPLDLPADVAPAEEVAEDIGASADALTDLVVPEDIAADVVEDVPVDAGPSWDAAAGPPTVFVTVNRTPVEMNGSVPYLGPDEPDTAFRLRLPLHRFTVDVEVQAAPGGAPVDPTSIELSAELAPAAGGESLTYDWSAALEWDGAWASRQASEDDALVPGVLTLYANAADIVGQYGEESVLTVDLAELPAHLDPFVTPDTWLVTFSRDLYSLELVDNGDGTYGLTPGPEPWTPDGVPDFDEAFKAVGLMSSNAETNAFVRHDLIEAIRLESYRIYLLGDDGSIGPDSVPIDFIFEGDPEADLLEGEPGVDYSAIAVGGDGGTSDIEGGYVGRADIDSNNQRANDNTVFHRGVYTGQIARIALKNAAAMMLLREIFPLTGVPLGEYEGDASFWEEGFDPADITDGRLRNRYNLYQFAIELISRAVSSTLCHEMGHSLGLVPPGVPPEGLFGGVDLPWTDSNPGSWHIDTPGLNVMQTGAVTNYLEAAANRPEFSALNLAYLRRRLIVDPQ